MIKRKGAGVMMAIMLVFVCGWVAIVGLVIKPVFWAGGLLCLFGGSAIGGLIAYLMKRWWFKGRLTQKCTCPWHLGMGPEMHCPVHGRPELTTEESRRRHLERHEQRRGGKGG